MFWKMKVLFQQLIILKIWQHSIIFTYSTLLSVDLQLHCFNTRGGTFMKVENYALKRSMTAPFPFLTSINTQPFYRC